MNPDNFWNDTYFNDNYSKNNKDIAQSLLNYISLIDNTDRVLDYGGGSGRITRRIHSICPETKIHLYDTSFHAIEKSYKNLQENDNIIRSHTAFVPQLKYNKIIFHRVLHNMLDEDIHILFKTLINSISTPCKMFISVKSKSCHKYKLKLNNKQFMPKDGGFYNPINKRYVKFYSLLDLTSLVTQYNFIVQEYGEFTESSFRNHLTNQYIYICGRYDKFM